KGLNYVKGKDNFDRSQVPAAGEAVVVKAPEFWTAHQGSIRFIGTETNEIPVVKLLLKFKGGQITDPANKQGLANLFATMMSEDTKNFTAEEMSLALEQLGSSIRFSTGTNEIMVQVRSLSKNLDKTLQLLEEKLLHPKFTQEDFDRNKKRTTELVKNALNRPAYVASTVFSGLIYGQNHPLGWVTSGTEESLPNIELADIQNYYQSKFSKANAAVVVVGDIKEEVIKQKLSFLDKMSDMESPLVILPQVPEVSTPVIHFVDVPG